MLIATLKQELEESYQSFRWEDDYEVNLDNAHQQVKSVNLDTLMIPCTFKPKVGGKFEKNISLVNINLGKYGSLKSCSSIQSFEKYLDSKLELFCDEY